MPAEFYEVQGRAPLQRKPSKPFELKGLHVLVMIVTFFAIVAAVNATMMTIAIRTMPGLDARNGYDPSQVYNQEIAAARARQDLGWRATSDVTLQGDVAQIAVGLTDREGRAVPDALVVARLKHPTDKRRDRELVLGRGLALFQGEATGISEGVWDLWLEVRGTPDGPALFASHQRIRLKG